MEDTLIQIISKSANDFLAVPQPTFKEYDNDDLKESFENVSKGWDKLGSLLGEINALHAETIKMLGDYTINTNKTVIDTLKCVADGISTLKEMNEREYKHKLELL